jgi:2-phospho-L-lactate guanylyltransferase
LAIAEVIVLIPVKPLSVAKSRLRERFAAGAGDLALAMAMDVAAAACAARSTTAVVLITDDPVVVKAAAGFGAMVVPDVPGSGLNPALIDAAAQVRGRWRDAALIVQPADCPAVRPDDFDAIGAWMSGNTARCFVADAAGTGTTTLAAPAGSALDPRYGPGSRAAHLASGALELLGPRWDRLRRDVDTAADLDAALELSVGQHTTTWLARHHP